MGVLLPLARCVASFFFSGAGGGDGGARRSFLSPFVPPPAWFFCAGPRIAHAAHTPLTTFPNTTNETNKKKQNTTEGGVSGEAIAEAFDAFEKGGGAGASPLAVAAASRQTIQESMRLVMLVRAYQVNGHFAATLDPLGLDARPPHDELDPHSFGFTETDMDREFFLGTWAGVAGFLSEDRPVRTLREILTRLRETYSGNIGYEVCFFGWGCKETWAPFIFFLVGP